MQRNTQGIAFGVAAVVFWSFGASCVYLGAHAAGTWVFVTVGSLTAAALQSGFLLLQRAKVKSAFALPARLWFGPVLCFVLYGLAWPWALASSSRERVVAVSLINYLWPVLTVLFSAWWVPGVKLTARTLLALLLAVAGLLAANGRDIIALSSRPTNCASGSWFAQALPYLLALTAAITWALYSTLLARWRSWASAYVTSPVGFAFIGLVGAATLALSARQSPAPGSVNGVGMLWTLLYGLGPLAAGYLLWELALARARVQTLSILAAGTPILSTLLLCCFLRRMPGLELVLAATLVSTGAVLSRRN